MRRYLFVILGMALIGVVSCTRLEAAPAQPIPPKEVTSEQLLDYDVVSSDGTTIGPVDGVVISMESGETEYIIVFLEDIYNFGKGAVHEPQDHYLPIPWSHLKVNANNKLVLDADANFVDAAPILTEVSDTSVAGWDMAVASYWRQ